MKKTIGARCHEVRGRVSPRKDRQEEGGEEISKRWKGEMQLSVGGR